MVIFSHGYAGRTKQFAKDKNAVTVGEFASLAGIIDTLIEDVRPRELDDRFAVASAERGLIASQSISPESLVTGIGKMHAHPRQHWRD